MTGQTKIITFPDGYNGHTVTREWEIIKDDGACFQLREVGGHLVRWCTHAEWNLANENDETRKTENETENAGGNRAR